MLIPAALIRAFGGLLRNHVEGFCSALANTVECGEQKSSCVGRALPGRAPVIQSHVVCWAGRAAPRLLSG
jgi:hypothetical protein